MAHVEGKPSVEEKVKSANRRLYDAVADRYESIDGRRSPDLEDWLRGNLIRMRERAPGGCLLDIGAGSGFVTRCAEGVFDRRIGIDISPKILAAGRAAFDAGAAADVDLLPFADGSFDAVVCFAVLHHLYAFEKLVAEVARALRPGGVFYSDHDMDRQFSRRFRLPLKLYRRLRRAKDEYLKASSLITSELYDLTEWQGQGIAAQTLIRLLEEAGFKAKAEFHWYGLSALTDRLFGPRRFPRGWAPLVSVTARKAGDARR